MGITWNDEDDWPAPDADSGVLFLGPYARMMFTSNSAGQTIGIIESHRDSEGRECGGAVTFDVPGAEGMSGPRWTVEQWEPLTISPSVLCRRCGNHGWIRNGRWVSA